MLRHRSISIANDTAATLVLYWKFVVIVNKQKALLRLTEFQLIISFCLSDTYKEAKEYASKKRYQDRVNYCESANKNKRRSSPKGHRKKIADALGNIRIKSELITRKKKALYILNLENDGRKVEDLNDTDIEEYQGLIDDDNNGVPQDMDDIARSSLPVDDEDLDDCIIIRAIGDTAIIKTGTALIEVDKDFSNEYSFTTNVS